MNIEENDTKRMKHFLFPFNIYRAQRRPGHPHIFVNKGTQGISIFDTGTGAIIDDKGFSAHFDPAGVINAWCLKSDGSALAIFNDDSYTACLVSFKSNVAAVDIAPPPFDSFWDLRYTWDDNICWLTGAKQLTIYYADFNNNTPAFIETGIEEKEKANFQWLTTINKLPVHDYNILRVETDKKQLVFHDYSTMPPQIGAINWVDGTSWSVNAPAEIFEVSIQQQSVFSMYEKRVDRINIMGEATPFCTPPEGFHFITMDTLPSSGENNGQLVTVSNSLDGATQSIISVYEL